MRRLRPRHLSSGEPGGFRSKRRSTESCGDFGRGSNPRDNRTGFGLDEDPQENCGDFGRSSDPRDNWTGFGLEEDPPEDCERLRPQQRSNGELPRLRPKQGSKVNRHGASAPGGDPGEAPRSFGFETPIQGEPRKASAFRGEPNGMEASGPASRLSSRTLGGTPGRSCQCRTRRDGRQALTGAASPDRKSVV